MLKTRKNINSDVLKWIWSCNEQIILLDRHDAYWINQASTGWTDKEAFRSFLSTYGLFRGKAGKYLSKHQKKFVDICNKYFRQPLQKGDFKEAQEIWKCAVSELKGKKSNVDEVLFWSASLKAFWFYHPDKLPMFDTYTRNALEDLRKNEIFIVGGNMLLPKRSVRPENFLLVFEEFYTQYAADQIELAEKYIHRDYKYKYRIADKYLWLHGSGKVDSTINTYRLGLNMAPSKKNVVV